jgi:predicted AAA+ superfamily ATPase
MSYNTRYLESYIVEDLEKKMVFISGPRQSGKTTLARKILNDTNPDMKDSRYMNWDTAEDRENIIREKFPAGKGLLVLDEIHKYSRWRQIVKGLYDKRKDELKIIVTGSGRLDYYRHGGDSLQGRYHPYRLHPFTYKEINRSQSFSLSDLLLYGGFPEPMLAGSGRESRRWSREYRSQLLREELNSLENVRDIALLEHLAIRLPELVGSPLSLNALRQDLQVSHQSIARWLVMFENIYMIFRIYPFGAPKIRAVKKEAKHYHLDWTVVDEESIRFENMIACHLLKWCHFRQDYEGYDTELRYFRDIDRREIDFVITENKKPIKFIECKLTNRDVNPTLRYMKQRFPETEAYQISFHDTEDFINKYGIRICSAETFLMDLI